jgi:DNA-directed RNA polymerase specialized sigma24 family protein
MDDHQSITTWIEGLKRGDSRAAAVIWENYFDRLVRLAHQKLGSLPRQVADEEDVALSALKSLVLRARDGRFPQLDDRDDLWKLLVVITARKVIARKRRHYAGKRVDAHVVAEAVLDAAAEDQRALEQILGSEPTPEMAAQVAEEFSLRIRELPDDEFRQIALWKLEGFTNREIAAKLNTYDVKIERKLRIIRRCWSQDEPARCVSEDA